MVLRADPVLLERFAELARLLETLPPPVRKALVTRAVREQLAEPVASAAWDSSTG
jgi:DNA-directed RNA polymerase specialized sigma24 family protein